MFSNIFKSPLTQCIDKFAKNKDIDTREKYKNICKVLEKIEITDDIQVINTQFTQLIHIWFNDNAILDEIYKHLTSIGVCVLHEIMIWINANNTGQVRFIITQNYGYDDMPESNKHYISSYLDEELYYNTQIRQCPNDIFAIPIAIYNQEDSMAHSNMLIVKRQPEQPVKILVEWFEPYGVYMKQNYEFEISQLVYNLFVYEPIVLNRNDIHIISASQNCMSLQMHVHHSQFKNSCAIFSLWYAIERLLNPLNDPSETYRIMESYLTKTDPLIVIKNIILSFMMLLHIDNKGVINQKKKINKKTLNQIIGGRKRTKRNKQKHSTHQYK